MAKLFYIFALLSAAGFTFIPSTASAQETTSTAETTASHSATTAITAPSDRSAVTEPTQEPEYRNEAAETQELKEESAESTSPVSLAIPESTAGQDTESIITESTTSAIADDQQVADVADSQTSVTLPEGIVYQVTKEGNGAQSGTTSTLLIHYTLYLANGPKVESSRDAEFPLPFEFSLGQGDAIKGMELGAAGMQVGERRKIFIPAELGYGAKGHGKNIPPNSDLIFDVELVDLK